MALAIKTKKQAARELAFVVPLGARGPDAARVVLRVLPATTLLVEAAEWAARRAVAAAQAESPEGASLPADDATALFYATYVGQLGRRVVQAWDVIDAETEEAVPCDPETVETALALNPDLAKAFDAAYTADIRKRRIEGNGSGPSPNGISAMGPATAPAAATQAAPSVLT